MRPVYVLNLTWYLVKRVLQTPVSSIMPTRNGIMARAGMMGPAILMITSQETKIRSWEKSR